MVKSICLERHLNASSRFKPLRNADDANPKIKNNMKKIIAATILILVGFIMVSDGIMWMFDCVRGYQYAFNMCAIFVLIPFSMYFALGIDEEEGAE